MIVKIGIPGMWAMVVIETYVMWRLHDKSLAVSVVYAIYASIIVAAASAVVLYLWRERAGKSACKEVKKSVHP